MAGLRDGIIRHLAVFGSSESKISAFRGRRAALSSVAEAPSNRTIVGPQFEGHLQHHNVRREPQMKRLVLASAIFLTLAPALALAEGRGGDAALGALSGAVVFGPVGAVAGAVVGYTAGPSIARSWGLRGSSRRDTQSRVKTRTVTPRAANPQLVQNGPAPSASSSVVQNGPASSASSSPPPVQTPAAPPLVQARSAPPV